MADVSWSWTMKMLTVRHVVNLGASKPCWSCVLSVDATLVKFIEKVNLSGSPVAVSRLVATPDAALASNANHGRARSRAVEAVMPSHPNATDHEMDELQKVL